MSNDLAKIGRFLFWLMILGLALHFTGLIMEQVRKPSADILGR